MIALGAKPDVLAAAALGQMDLLRSFFDDDGRPCPVRDAEQGDVLRDAVGLALLYAYVREQRDAVDFLLEKDNWNMIGVNNGAALHRAAFAGDLDMVRRLVERGADLEQPRQPIQLDATRMGRTQPPIWLCSGCGRIAPSTCTMPPRSIFTSTSRHDSRRIRHPSTCAWTTGIFRRPRRWHWAASMGHGRRGLLLDHGADVNIVAGNGMTPLDVADANGSSEVVALLVARGAHESRRSAAHAHGPTERTEHTIEAFEQLASDVVAYQSGEPTALQRVRDFFKRPAGTNARRVWHNAWARPRATNCRSTRVAASSRTSADSPAG